MVRQTAIWAINWWRKIIWDNKVTKMPAPSPYRSARSGISSDKPCDVRLPELPPRVALFRVLQQMVLWSPKNWPNRRGAHEDYCYAPRCRDQLSVWGRRESAKHNFWVSLSSCWHWKLLQDKHKKSPPKKKKGRENWVGESMNHLFMDVNLAVVGTCSVV